MKNPRIINTNKEAFNALPDKEKMIILATVTSWAPSSHNTQPWHFSINTNKIVISPDFSKSLAIGDKNHRQLHISLGAAVTNTCLAANCLGLNYKKNYIENSNALSVEISFENLLAKNFDRQLWQALSTRHSNRLQLSKQVFAQEYFKKIAEFLNSEVNVHFIREENQKKQLKNIVGEALELSFNNTAFRHELSQWIKPSLSKYSEGMTGYYLGIPWPVSFILPWVIKNFNISKMQKKMHSQWIDSAPILGIITGKSDKIKNWVLAGEFFEHMATSAEQLEIRTGVMATPIESDYGKIQLQALLNTSDYPLMFFRQGFGPSEKHFSPRRPIKELVSYEART